MSVYSRTIHTAVSVCHGRQSCRFSRMCHTQAVYRCIRDISLLEDTERGTIKNAALEYGTTDSLSRNNKSRISQIRVGVTCTHDSYFVTYPYHSHSCFSSAACCSDSVVETAGHPCPGPLRFCNVTSAVSTRASCDWRELSSG